MDKKFDRLQKEILIKGNSGVSKINDHAKTVSRTEQCFFCLLILVMFIYGFGILTAIVLLSSIMWYSWTHISQPIIYREPSVSY